MAAYEGVRHAVQAGVELERPLAPATKQTPVRNVHGFFILRFGPAALRWFRPRATVCTRSKAETRTPSWHVRLLYHHTASGPCPVTSATSEAKREKFVEMLA